MKIAWIIISKLFWVVLDLFRKPKESDKPKRDKQLADNIRNGNGQEVAEEWKRRRNEKIS